MVCLLIAGLIYIELLQIFGVILSLIILFLGLAFIYFSADLSTRKKKARLYLTIAFALILVGYGFKMNHWHGAGILVIVGVMMFCFSYLPLLVINRYDRWKNFTSNRFHTLVVSISDLLSFLAISYGALSKFMHWPGSIYLFISGAILFVISFIGWNMIFKRSLQKSRESEDKLADALSELKVKHEIIEEKHREITDSINYAQRIQRSFLATKELLDEHLIDYFVFFQPKEAVSGDFYWASYALAKDAFYYATADSTGHGVPGAIMSILNISSLEKSIETKKSTAAILNETRKIIIDRLKKDGSKQGGKDGMDAVLIELNKEKTKLTFAAANNPVWILRDGNMMEFEPDKMPVGKHDKDHIPFTEKEVDLKKGDIIYTFTDGMPDQFGGPKGKKYKYSRLKDFLIGISTLPMPQQKIELQLEFERWKGDLEQIDDVCIIGVKI